MRFGVALLAAFSLASPAMAKYALIGQVKDAVETFEEYNVGDVIYGHIGGPRPFLFLHGVVEEENGNKYLELFNANPLDKHIGYTTFETHGWLGGGGTSPGTYWGTDVRSTIKTFDIFSAHGGVISNRQGNFETGNGFVSFGSGWQTVNFNQTSSSRKASVDAKYWINGPGLSPFKIDNIRYDALQTKIPEPASWMMMIAGFGLSGAAMRRRRSMQPA